MELSDAVIDSMPDEVKQELTTRCIHQIFRPEMSLPDYMRPAGMGDCSICTADPIHNGYCSAYKPILFRTFMVSTSKQSEETQ